jgi:hypothetical protein
MVAFRKGGIMYAIKNKRQADQTASPEKYPQGKFNDKPCRKCGNMFSPKAPSHLYCSQECADWGVTTAYLQRNYGIDLDKYNEMLHNQDHKCGICKSPGFIMNKDTHKMLLVVDHDHNTGKVRKLLCHNCNRALGLFKDSKEVISTALQYLKEHE